jgi:hypothetical protein
MNKFIAITSVWILSWMLGIAIATQGYGLKVESWSWLVLGGIFGRILVEAMPQLVKNEKE